MKHKLLLAFLTILNFPAVAHSVEPDSIEGDQPTGTTTVFFPATGGLVNGANYYIYDNNKSANGRYGFFADQGAVKGVNQTPAEAYAANSVTDAIYVWTAKQKEDDPNQWYFQNVGTGRYISNNNNSSDTEIGYCTIEQYPDKNDTFFKVNNVATGKQMDANCLSTIDLSWWEGSGHPIQFYAAVEDGDAWQLAANEVSSYTITCNFILDGEIFKTETVSGAAGTEYTFKAPEFCKGEEISGVITKYNTVYNVEIELALPFHASESLEAAKYQALAIHTSSNAANPYTLTYDEDYDAVKAPATATTATEPYNANQLFALIGSYEEGFKLYSKGAEQYVIAATSPQTDVTLGNEDEATVWQVKASKVAGEQFFCLLNGETTDQYLNLNAPRASVSEWTDNDNGSTMWAYGVSQPVVNYYTDYFNNADSIVGVNTSLLSKGKALIESIDAWEEIPASTSTILSCIIANLERQYDPESSKMVIVKLPGGTLHLAEEHAGTTVRLMADEGFEFHSASLDDADISYLVGEQGHFTVPTVEKPTVLNVVFKQISNPDTEINAVSLDDEVRVTVHGKRVSITGKNADTEVRAYDLRGVLLEDTTESDFYLDYSGVVILRIGADTFKFAI